MPPVFSIKNSNKEFSLFGMPYAPCGTQPKTLMEGSDNQ